MTLFPFILSLFALSPRLIHCHAQSYRRDNYFVLYYHIYMRLSRPFGAYSTIKHYFYHGLRIDPVGKCALHTLESVSFYIIQRLCTVFLSKLTSFPTFEWATFCPSDTIFLCLSIFDVYTTFILENSDLLWIIPPPISDCSISITQSFM